MCITDVVLDYMAGLFKIEREGYIFIRGVLVHAGSLDDNTNNIM